MRINSTTVRMLYEQYGITQKELACRIGIGRNSLSNALSGRRCAVRKTLSGLLRLFPNESVASLTNERRVES